MRKDRPKIPYDDPLRHRKTPREMLKEPISTECDACRDNIIQVRRDTIAVIFVPGIMGSKLNDPKNAPVWNPDDLSLCRGHTCGQSQKIATIFLSGKPLPS